MPEFDFSGAYVSVESVKEGDVLTIIGVGLAEEKQHPTEKVIINGVLKPKTYQVLNIPVEVNKVQKTYTVDNKTGLRFQEAWGRDFSKWVSKQFKAKIEEYVSYGAKKQRVAGYPIVDSPAADSVPN